MTPYNTAFIQDPVAFMKKYSCNPDDALAGNKGVRDAADFNTPNLTQAYVLRAVAPMNRVGYLDFKKIHHADAKAFTGHISVEGDYQQNAARVPSYFLPWDWNSIISLDIPPNQGPRFFFTAAINGCSVFIKGTPRNPTIYHAGGDTESPDPVEGARVWRDMMQQHNATQGAIVGEVNKTQYVNDKVEFTTVHSAHLNKDVHTVTKKYGTPTSRKFEAWLKKEQSDTYIVESVSPTGCVMGLRDWNGDWAFYLQENATIVYHKFNRVKTGLFTSKKTKILGTQQVSMRPMRFTQIFPGGGHVKFTPNLERVLKD